jgi:hypothetical protein
VEVNQQETFGAILEREMGRLPPGGRQVEVINFGVRGYGTAQELLTLRCCVWAYQPDIVLLAFLPTNDVSDNHRSLDRTSTSYARPYFVMEPEGWRVDRSFRSNLRYRVTRLVSPLVAHSRVLQLLIRVRNLVIRRRANSPDPPEGIPPGLTIGQDVYREPGDSAWKAAWSTTEALVATLAREVVARGSRFGAVVITSGAQVYPDSQVRGRLLRGLGIPDFGYPGRRLAALGAREGFPVLDLMPGFQAYADRTGSFLHGFTNRRLGLGHWNQLGHRLAGERIAGWLADW